MSRQTNWNKSFWKKLDTVQNIDNKAILNIISDEVNKVDMVMEAKTPVLFGGLKFSKYAIVVPTPTGYSGRIGYANQKHIDLDPSDPGYDTITNPDLMEHLMDSQKRSNDVMDIADAMDEFKDNCKNRIKDYWRTQIRR